MVGSKGKKYIDGAVIGALLGVALVIAINATGSPLASFDFIIGWLDSLIKWVTVATWWPFTGSVCLKTAIACSNNLRYIFAALIGAVIGMYVDRT